MNKKVPLFVFLMLLFLAPIMAAVNISTCADGDSNCKVNNAYLCLQDKINTKKCSALSSEEKVFSLLATGLCKNEVTKDSKFKSDIKFTAQAVLGMEKSGSDSKQARDWLISQNRTSTGIDWFLEIESPKATACAVKTSTGTSTVLIDENKQITSIAGGSCFTQSDGNYWLKVNSNCYADKFEISCDQQFLTTLLYQKQGADTIYVSENTHSSSAGGSTNEKVNSFCLRKGTSCDYESTLWASFALSSTGSNATAFLPYLIVMAQDNQGLLPESFLYYLSGNADFKNQLLAKQINGKWWLSANDKYYGTAQALNPLKYEESTQKAGAIDWLLNEAQGTDGCWDSGNIRNTGFLLYSIWPKNILSNTSNGTLSGVDCTQAGYFCTSQVNCGAQVLSGYSCSGAFVCCSQNIPLQTCSEQNGKICSSSQVCAGIGSLSVSASDVSSGQICCAKGECQKPTTTGTSSQCQLAGGTCRVSSCLSGESKTSDSCDFSSDSCCIASTSSKTPSFKWIIMLIVLIGLVVLAIVFRENLQMLLLRLKSKFSGSGGSSATTSSGRPPSFPPFSGPYQRPMLRRIIPQNQRPSQMPRAKSQSEVDEVLKKLRDMSK